MTTRITTQPELTSSEKSRLSIFLVDAFGTETLTGQYPLPSYRLCLYVGDNARMINSGRWMHGSGYVEMANEQASFPIADRLPYLLALVQFCTPSEPLTQAASKAIARFLLGEFNALNQSMVVSPVPSDGIAFSTDNRSASRIGGEWMTASGETVDVSGPEWTVCATTLTESGVTVPADGPHVFHIGDRVRYAEIPHVPELGSGVGTITEELYDRDGRDAYHLDAADGSNYYVFASDLSPIDVPAPPRPLAVGDRVRFSSIPGASDQPGWGVIESGNNRESFMVRVGNPNSGLWNVEGIAPDFAVGDRVHWNDPLGVASVDGTISRYNESVQLFHIDILNDGGLVIAERAELSSLPTTLEEPDVQF